MNLSNRGLKLTELQDDVWYYIEADMELSNEITAIKYQNGQVSIQYIGGDFEEPLTFVINWTKESFNEAWKYEFPEDEEYPDDITMEQTLGGIESESVLFYPMLNDLSYDAVNAKEKVEKD